MHRFIFFIFSTFLFNSNLNLIHVVHAAEQQEQVDCSSYTQSISLNQNNNDITIQYVSTNTTLSVRMSSPKAAYLAFGVSDAGKMANSEAVIGTVGQDVRLYSMTSSSVQIIEDVSRQNLINATFTQNDSADADADGSVLEFTMLLNDGTANKGIDGTGATSTIFVWSQGVSNNVQSGHFASARGSLELTLTPCGQDDDEDDNNVVIVGNDGFETTKRLFLIHGILALLSFAILMPIATVAAIGRNNKLLSSLKICGKDAWFALHYYMHSLATLLAMLLFGLVVYNISRRGADVKHFDTTHGVVGLVVFLLVILHVALALFRPPATATGAETNDATTKDGFQDQVESVQNATATTATTTQKPSSKSGRNIWFMLHRITAVIILAMAFYQIHSGIDLYMKLYNVQTNYISLFWICEGVLLGLLSVFIVYSKI